MKNIAKKQVKKSFQPEMVVKVKILDRKGRPVKGLKPRVFVVPKGSVGSWDEMFVFRYTRAGWYKLCISGEFYIGLYGSYLRRLGRFPPVWFDLNIDGRAYHVMHGETIKIL